MNGVHDLGGMHGFGPIVIDPDEPMFHADWEPRVRTLMSQSTRRGLFTLDARTAELAAGLFDEHEHYSMGGCLGPCALSNVALVLFGGHQIWFHSIAGEDQVRAIYDYIESMVRADRYLPPPSLEAQVFDVFDWPAPRLRPVEPTYRD